MRLKTTLLLSFLALSVTNAQAAHVLVPGENGTSSTAAESASGMGLIPRQTAPKTTIAPQPTMPEKAADAPTTAAGTTPDSSAGVDAVNFDILKTAKIEDIRQLMPTEYQKLSDSELTKLISFSEDKLKNGRAAKFIKKDPKTGQLSLDTKMLANDAEPETSIQIVTGGGKLAPKVLTKQEIMIEKVTRSLGKPRLDPRVEKALAMAKAQQEIDDKNHERDPIIVNDLNMESYDFPLFSTSLKLGVAKEYTWGQNAATHIERALGYEGDEILNHCQLRLNIYVNTDDKLDLYHLALYSNTQKSIGYAGNLKNIEVTPLAVCVKPMGPLPRHGSPMFRVGDKYGISMANAKCDAPAYDPKKSPPETLLISYNGDEKINCIFK